MPKRPGKGGVSEQTFYLTFIATYASLTVANFLVFMALWLVPQSLFIANWVNQYERKASTAQI